MKRLALIAALLGATPLAAQTVAITNAKLVVGDGGGPVDGGTVVISGGRVTAAGRGVAVPGGARVIDAQGKWVSPGLVAGFTRLGIVEVDGVRETNDAGADKSDFSAALDVSLAVNPRETPIAINRAEGITRAVVAPDTGKTIFAGQGAVIDLGMDPNAVMRPRAFQFVEFGESAAATAGGSRPAAFAMFRNALQEARGYARNPGQAGGRITDGMLTKLDAAALVPMVEGRVPMLVHVERASDIVQVLDLVREFPSLKLVLVGASEAWMVAPQIAAARVPVLASALADLPASFEALAATQSNIGRLQAAGVTVGIGMINDDEARQARLIKQYAGNLVALTRVPGATGLDWGHAFATISSAPAAALGLDGEIGSLRPGRRADVVIWDGDPLEVSSAPVMVMIDGVEQSLVNRQTKLRDRYAVPQEGALPKAYER
ncbi:amidohydrolase family protein [Sphingomonas prati]|uniref:Imidazolonepropionase-like amidohydrolase n=1 Tax=Sphingomonas prati TaxID=1843237 RepID=A0A7W9BT75_9SPHN|nr:amidohydrolase family protein [Sphingomonas prati]MBB5729565.1 imidazolonepropionase-like amidohydrolase [Sphingomonas prati]GGE76479.1 amidohydrolase [Sphingomonas prati]